MVIIKEWIICILIGAFIVNIVNMLLPNTKLKPYINLVTSFIFVFIVVSPVVSLLSGEGVFEDKILEYINSYNEKYLEYSSSICGEEENLSLNREYEENLKRVLSLKLDEYGYKLEDIDIEGTDIKNIRIKDEKNKATSNSEDDVEAFNEIREKDEKDLQDDLIRIFKVSIDKIEID